VKHGFLVRKHDREYMWVRVDQWREDRVQGQLLNQSRYRRDLRVGAPVLVEEEIYDWQIVREDGSSEGGSTNEAVLAQGEMRH
jgi:hypothetical protein